jgi:hypothetical protein
MTADDGLDPWPEGSDDPIDEKTAQDPRKDT